MKCRGCNKEMGYGEASIEYCDGFCAYCYGKERNSKMMIPQYKEFHNWVEPVIRKNIRGYSVQVVAKHKNGEEITTGLISSELRELADYLDSKKGGK